MGALAGVIIVVAVIAVFTMANLGGVRFGRGPGRSIDPPEIDPQTGQPLPPHHGTGGTHGQHGGGHHGGGFSGGGHHGGGFSGGGDAGGHHGH